MIEALMLFAAGFVGGVMNTVAGGGTFVTFPALVLAGIPDVAANATSTVAALPGYLAGALGFRHELTRLDRSLLARLTLITVLGGLAGAGLLMLSSNATFAAIVPFLLLAATLAFLYGDRVRAWTAQYRRSVTPFGAGGLIGVAIYGGYFNGGLGIVLLALFTLWGMTDLHQMNGLKTWLSFALSVISAIAFALGGILVWSAALPMMAGTITGGYLGAPLARRIPRHWLRALIATIGLGMATVFFIRLVT